jgi:hypothetical protein
MKLLFSFLFAVGLSFGAEGATKGDVNMDDLFKQLDSVISSKKDDKKIDAEKKVHQNESTAKREKNYKAFNEASKKYHIFRANKILKTVQDLKKEYKTKSIQIVHVQRFSQIGDKKFAYVSSSELDTVIKQLKVDGQTLKKLTNFERLLGNIKEFDIKTIAKVLIIVEQEIMNLLDMGIKKFKPQLKKQSATVPVLIKTDTKFDTVFVKSIDSSTVTFEVKSL